MEDNKQERRLNLEALFREIACIQDIGTEKCFLSGSSRFYGSFTCGDSRYNVGRIPCSTMFDHPFYLTFVHRANITTSFVI